MYFIGPGRNLDLPGDCHLLGDAGYRNQYHVISPYRRPEIQAAPPNEHPQMLLINDTIRRHRIYVEHLIGQLKIYRILDYVWRNPRPIQRQVVELCAGLAQMRRNRLDQV